jgi:hypothetical protein
MGVFLALERQVHPGAPSATICVSAGRSYARPARSGNAHDPSAGGSAREVDLQVDLVPERGARSEDCPPLAVHVYERDTVSAGGKLVNPRPDADGAR